MVEPMPKTILVVPCFNEADRLDPQPFLEFANNVADAGLLFVDDGSTDDTRTQLRALTRQPGRNISLAELDTNRGKGEAVRHGMLSAIEQRPDYVGFWDADLSTPLTAALDLVGVLDANPDLVGVIGSRVQRLGADIKRDTRRHYIGRFFATLASVALGVPVYDTQCGAKLFRVTTRLEDALSRPFSSRWVFDVELLARIISREDHERVGSLMEHPLEQWHEVPGSKISLRDAPAALTDLARIWIQRVRTPRGPSAD